MSMTMEVLRPDSTEPIRKMTMAAWKKTFLPYMSPSLPHSGVETVVASRYEVMTQAMCEPPLEVADDRRQRRGHDRLVERGEHHAAHQRADDEQDAAAAEPRQGAAGVVVRHGDRGPSAGTGVC